MRYMWRFVGGGPSDGLVEDIPFGTHKYPQKTFRAVSGGEGNQVAVYEYQQSDESDNLTQRTYRFTGTVTRDQLENIKGDWQ